MECFQSGRRRIVFEWKGPFPDIGFCVWGGGDRTPHGNKIYFKGGGLSPTSTAVSSGERGGMISRF